jgi:hypothetical protein
VYEIVVVGLNGFGKFWDSMDEAGKSLRCTGFSFMPVTVWDFRRKAEDSLSDG